MQDREDKLKDQDGGRVGDDSGSRTMMTEANTTYQGEYGRTEIQKQKKKVERKPDEAQLPRNGARQNEIRTRDGTIGKEGDEKGWRGKESDEE